MFGRQLAVQGHDGESTEEFRSAATKCDPEMYQNFCETQNLEISSNLRRLAIIFSQKSGYIYKNRYFLENVQEIPKTIRVSL
jgi:hypothetical protein